MEVTVGTHISDALLDALEEAATTGRTVTFDFNGTPIEVRPEDTVKEAKKRAEEALGHEILSREEEARRAREQLAKQEAETKAAIAEAGAMTEVEMRDADVPWPGTPEELTAYIATLVDRPHDYGTCVYAMSMAAMAAFYYVSGKLGVTGFQASCADMDILRRSRRMEHGFRIVDYSHLLYPQYWNGEVAPIFRAELASNPDKWKEEARKLLDESGHASLEVLFHWRIIADGQSP